MKNYQTLAAKVDDTCQRIQQKYCEHIACHRGCSSCCRRHITVFPVEAVALAEALGGLPEDTARRLREKARQTSGADPCPLLEFGACALYAWRPIICRTHGLPILTIYNRQPSIGFCRKNFQHLSVIPADAAIDVDRLNKTLIAINRFFISECAFADVVADRLFIADALQLKPRLFE